jgi:hypothetical protein
VQYSIQFLGCWATTGRYPISSSGDLSAADPPVPIPNTVVKRRSGDDTGGASLWENSSLPEELFCFSYIIARNCRQSLLPKEAL